MTAHQWSKDKSISCVVYLIAWLEDEIINLDYLGKFGTDSCSDGIIDSPQKNIFTWIVRQKPN